ncbi:MAG: hypothetical protein GEV03_17130 [Streptosporangiales bacterium]|nr:hypothetical protein [Streptosporangiales bacterium]
MASNFSACVAALVGAFFLALAAALQQRGVASAPSRGALNPALLLHLARKPIWVAGVITGLVGVGLQVVALRWGPLPLVQPVAVTTLLFALPVGAMLQGRRVTRVEVYAAAVVALGLGSLLLTLNPASVAPAVDPGRLGALAAIVAIGLLVVVLGALRLRGEGRTLLLSAGAGVAFGTTAGFVEMLVHRAGERGISVFASWLTLAAMAASVAGFLLSQGAYRSGRLATALATILVTDPLTAIGVGAFALREPVSMSLPLVILAETLLIVVGIVVLARSSQGARRTYAAAPNTVRAGGAPRVARG